MFDAATLYVRSANVDPTEFSPQHLVCAHTFWNNLFKLVVSKAHTILVQYH